MEQDGKWRLKGSDSFDETVYSTQLLPGRYETQALAEAAAKVRLEDLAKNPASARWDHVHIVQPDGSEYRYST